MAPMRKMIPILTAPVWGTNELILEVICHQKWSAFFYCFAALAEIVEAGSDQIIEIVDEIPSVS